MRFLLDFLCIIPYTVTVKGESQGVHITVDLDQPVPRDFLGKLCFNLELFPGELFDQPWIMDDQQGIFPRQPNGPTLSQPALFEHSGHIESDHIRTTRERLAGPLNEYSPLIADDLIAQPMAPVNFHHFGGYSQGPSTLTRFKSGEHVPGLNQGGWHDAGDFDLRVESQAGECYILSLAYEEFNVNYDVTSIDQQRKLVEIHQPDGKNDILQQVEHGMLSVVGAYDVLGRLYRGIICRNLRQYVLLGDGAAMTDGIPGNEDDRWVFTEENPARELTTAAQIAANARVLRDFNPDLAGRCLHAAQELYSITCVDPNSDSIRSSRIHAACELFLTTGDALYRQDILTEKDFILNQIVPLGWIVARVVPRLQCEDFQTAFTQAMVNASFSTRPQVALLSAGECFAFNAPRRVPAGFLLQNCQMNLYNNCKHEKRPCQRIQ